VSVLQSNANPAGLLFAPEISSKDDGRSNGDGTGRAKWERLLK
jgi:hypothetical protein